MPLPAFVPALALLAGAGLAALLETPRAGPGAAAALACAGGAGMAAWRARGAWTLALALGAGAAAGWTLLGVARAEAERSMLRELFDAALAGDPRDAVPTLVEGRLVRDASPTPYGASLSLDVERLLVEGVWREARGGLRASVTGELAPVRIDEWRAGRRVRAPVTLRRPGTFHNPGARDLEVDLNRRGIVLVGSVKSALLVDVVARADPARELAAAARARVRAAVGGEVGRFDERSAAVVAAILIADRGGIGDEVRRRLQEAGTYHVIAISGGNIAILAGLVLALLHLVRAPWRPAAALTMAALIGYAFLVGDEPSVVRATLAAVAYLSARLFDHRTPPLNALAAAAAVIVAVMPLGVYDAGFALSFGATAGILLGATPLTQAIVRRAWSRAEPPRWAVGAAAVMAATIAAELALLPVAAWFFSRITLAGLLLNLAAVPLMTAVQVAGLAVVALEGLVPSLAPAAGVIAHYAVLGIVESARLVDVAPWLSWRVPPPSAGLIALYYAGWMVRLGPWHRVRPAATAVVLLAGLAVAAAPPVLDRLAAAVRLQASGCLPAQADGRLHMTFLDVGQADATLVRFPDGRFMLVDAGGTPGGGAFDVGGRVVAPALWRLGVRRLEALVITHGHPDHAGGASSVIRDFRPREVWEGVQVPSDGLMQSVLAETRRAGGRWRRVRAGERYAMGGVLVDVLHPAEPDWERPHVRNDDSVVLEIRIGRVSIVLPGDIERDIERELAPRMTFGGPGPRLLKAPHHGSASSSTPRFLEAVRPSLVVFSAGRGNRFGHPAPAVVDRYARAGAAIYRTDRHGAVAVATDGKRFEVATCLQ